MTFLFFAMHGLPMHDPIALVPLHLCFGRHAVQEQVKA